MRRLILYAPFVLVAAAWSADLDGSKLNAPHAFLLDNLLRVERIGMCRLVVKARAERAEYTAESTVRAIAEIAHDKSATKTIQLQGLGLLAKIQGLMVDRQVTAALELAPGGLAATADLVAQVGGGQPLPESPAAPPGVGSREASGR